MRASIVSLTLSLVVLALIGCGNDDNTTPDASAPVFKGFDADEGGEIRIEHIRFNATTNATRIVAFVYANPGTTKYFPFPSLSGCTDTTMKRNWPIATNPIADRVYLDPGDIIISSPTSSTNVTPKPALTMPRMNVEGRDFLARPHPANKWFFYFNLTDGDTFLTPNAFLDIIMTGSADMPPQVFNDVSFMPADYEMTAPTLEAPPVVLRANTALTFTWSRPTQNKPADMAIISLVGFVGAGASDDGPAVLCVEPDDGEVTVSAAMVDVVRAKYPGGGILARQTFTHIPKELIDKNGPTGKRLDVISTWCTATPYTVQ